MENSTLNDRVSHAYELAFSLSSGVEPHYDGRSPASPPSCTSRRPARERVHKVLRGYGPGSAPAAYGRYVLVGQPESLVLWERFESAPDSSYRACGRESWRPSCWTTSSSCGGRVSASAGEPPIRTWCRAARDFVRPGTVVRLWCDGDNSSRARGLRSMRPWLAGASFQDSHVKAASERVRGCVR